MARTAPITIGFPMAGDAIGGSHYSLLGLLEGLDREQFKPIMIVEHPQGRIAELFSAFEQLPDPSPPRESFAAGRDFSLADFVSTLSGLRRRAALLKQSGIAIVHTNDGRTHATWALATKLARRKLLWHHRADPRAKGLRFLAPWVADKIVTVSRFSMPSKSFTAATRDAQVVFSPFETDVEVDRTAMRAQLLDELGASGDTVICGYFGSFIDRKRPIRFIEAVAELRTLIDRPVRGVMFGEATHPELERKMQERIAQADVAGTVKIMGYRTPGASWIAACDLLLVPAVGEPLGRTLVEAMLVGTPVVATRSGGNPEAILDGTGLLVPPEDPTAMAKGCANIVAEPDRATAMIAGAKASAQARFSRARHIDSISTIYRDLAGETASLL